MAEVGGEAEEPGGKEAEIRENHYQHTMIPLEIPLIQFNHRRRSWSISIRGCAIDALFPNQPLHPFKQHRALSPKLPLSILPARPRLGHRSPETLAFVHLLQSLFVRLLDPRPPFVHLSPLLLRRLDFLCEWHDFGFFLPLESIVVHAFGVFFGWLDGGRGFYLCCVLRSPCFFVEVYVLWYVMCRALRAVSFLLKVYIFSLNRVLVLRSANCLLRIVCRILKRLGRLLLGIAIRLCRLILGMSLFQFRVFFADFCLLDDILLDCDDYVGPSVVGLCGMSVVTNLCACEFHPVDCLAQHGIHSSPSLPVPAYDLLSLYGQAA